MNKKYIKSIIIKFFILGSILSILMTKQVNAINYNMLLINGIASREQVEKIVTLDTLLEMYSIHPNGPCEDSKILAKLLSNVSKAIQNNLGTTPQTILAIELKKTGVIDESGGREFVSKFIIIRDIFNEISRNVDIDDLDPVYRGCCEKLDKMKNGIIDLDLNLRSVCEAFVRCYEYSKSLRHSIVVFNSSFHLEENM